MLPVNSPKKRIFISKPIEELEVLAQKCTETNSSLFATALIDFEAIPFDIDHPFDVIFFASIRAARFFLMAHPIPSETQVACIGNATAQKINALGQGVSFIGTQASNPVVVGETFRTWLGERRVFFPLSSESKRTIPACIPSEQREEKTVYRTRFTPQKIAQMDVYIFTSPSNVESYMRMNTAPVGRIIAWGETTKKALQSFGIRADEVLKNGDVTELIELLGF